MLARGPVAIATREPALQQPQSGLLPPAAVNCGECRSRGAVNAAAEGWAGVKRQASLRPNRKTNIFMAQFVDLGADVSSSIPDYTFKVNACLWAAAAANHSFMSMHGLEK